MATVSRQRVTIWLDADSGEFDVRTEDDMVMIEATDAHDNEIEVFICPDLFDSVVACIERIKAR